jgi:hypothetical protein
MRTHIYNIYHACEIAAMSTCILGKLVISYHMRLLALLPTNTCIMFPSRIFDGHAGRDFHVLHLIIIKEIYRVSTLISSISWP